MSIDRCCKCERIVDTDADDDCYQPDPRMSLVAHPDLCICKHCREREEIEFEEMIARDMS